MIVLRAFILIALLWTGLPLPAEDRPNVILIICDDLNTDIEGYYGGHPQAKTPQLRRLMDSALTFQNAHCVIPICAPSRTAMMMGVYPRHSRNYGFEHWFKNETLDNTRSIPEHFKANGYYVLGTGKILHHHKAYQYHEFHKIADYGPYAFDGEKQVAHPAVPAPFREMGRVNGSLGAFERIEGRDYGDGKAYSWQGGNWKGTHPLRWESEEDRDLTPDEENGRWAVERLKALAAGEQEKPFFMTVGFLRPHTPLVVPQRYFDRFPLETLKLPEILAGDAEDTFLVKTRKGDDLGTRMYQSLIASYPIREEGLKRFVQAYLACVASVDDLIGEMVKVVDESSLKENTIIIVTSDHGWGNGPKDYVYKNALWEESTRIPLIMRVPGLTKAGSECLLPVSHIDLYPTLIDLCRLPEDTRKNETGHLPDGFSFRSLLINPVEAEWGGPKAALTVVQTKGSADPSRQNYALRTKDWRYIRYHTGDEELYDCQSDPREWHNLAADHTQQERLQSFRRLLNEQLAIRLVED